ncbi:hypothetical protein BRC82_10345 [Halobacteriales archaeon QS_1_67_19]|nr:MAG: hypothetical protein BRC82_10345 [Halobacteriales archaeon QS_1_67_19]
MNRRLLLAFASLALLATAAGCTGVFGSGEISEKQLSKDASYDWDTSTDVTVNITDGQYQAVYDLSNRSEIAVYERESLGEEQPVEVSAVKFRYPNGTVVSLGQEHVEKRDSETVIRPPREEGMIAYTASHRGKSFSIPTYVEGSYEVVLPRGMRIGNMLLSQVRPSEYTTTQQDGRVHIVWPDASADNIVIRYYLARDLTIFGGLIAAGVVIALLGLAYFRLQIRQLEREREEMGLNVDTGDDEFNQGPPPGMG